MPLPLRLSLIYLFLFLASIVIYRNSFAVGFRLDDVSIAQTYQNLGQRDFFKRSMALKTDKFRPIEVGSFGLMVFLFQKNIFLYHLVGCALLSLAAWSLYLFLRQVFAWSVPLSLASAMLFLAHPLNSLGVCWIVGEYISLKTAAILLACCWACKAREVKYSKHAVFALLALGFALMCHETAIMGPVYILTLFYLKGDSWRSALKRSVPYFLLSAAFFVIWSGSHAGAWSGVAKPFLTDFSLPGYLESFFKLVSWYAAMLVHPAGIVTVFSTSASSGSNRLPAVVLLLSICLFFFLASRPRSAERLGLLWFIAGFAPVTAACFYGHPGHSGIFVVEPFWLGMSLVGFIIFLVSLFKQLMQARQGNIAFAGMILIFTLWAVLADMYGTLWQDSKVFYIYFTQQAPLETGTNCTLANEFMEEKNFILAREYYGKCFQNEQGPVLGNYYFYLAAADLQELKWGEAEKNLHSALKYKPSLAEAAFDLGILYFNSKDWDRAKKYFTYALNCNPLHSAGSPLGQSAIGFLKRMEPNK